MRRLGWALSAVSFLLLALPAAAHVSPKDTAGYYWVDSSEEGISFVDPTFSDPQVLPLEAGGTVPMRLPFPFVYYARVYDHVRATADGRLELSFLGGLKTVPGERGETQRFVPPRDDTAYLDVFQGVHPGPRSMVVWNVGVNAVTMRWVDFQTSPVEPVTFEVHLREDGRIRFQYLHFNSFLNGPSYGRVGTIGLNDPSGTPTIQAMSGGTPAIGFDLVPGGVLEFPRDFDPFPRTPMPTVVMCPPAFGLDPDFVDWCQNTTKGPDGIPGNGDDQPECIGGSTAGDPYEACNTPVSQEWNFNEGAFCADCPYTFYVRVDCGEDMHIPTHDVEAMSVGIRDMNTGFLQEIRAINECAMRADAGNPFIYCDACSLAGIIVPKDDPEPAIGKPANSCTTPFGSVPESSCLQYRDLGTMVAWGAPIDSANPDQDGSGVIEQDEMRIPPCENCDEPECQCGRTTGANRVTEEQVIDVVLESSFLTGIYRLEIVSGGFDWQLFTNCDGTNLPQYAIYPTCDRALQDYAPLPQLTLDPDPTQDFVIVDENCPDSVTVAVRMCNIGGIAVDQAPFTIDFDDPSGNPILVEDPNVDENNDGDPTNDCDGTPANCTPKVFNGDNANHATDVNCQAPLEVGECRTCTYVIDMSDTASTDMVTTVNVDAADVILECRESPGAARCNIDLGNRTRTINSCVTECTATAEGSVRAPVQQDSVTGLPIACPGQEVTIDGQRSRVDGCIIGQTEYLYERFNNGTGMFEPIPDCGGGTWTTDTSCTYMPASPDPSVDVTMLVWVSTRCSSSDNGDDICDPATECCDRTDMPLRFVLLADTDGDGVCDQGTRSASPNDNCASTPNPGQEDMDIDPTTGQPEPDGVGDACDNCLATFNPSQEDTDWMDIDGDGIYEPFGDDGIPGNADDESDGGNACDNCDSDWNPGQEDGELDDTGAPDPDGVGDICDNCPDVANNSLFDFNGDGVAEETIWGEWPQSDLDTDGFGDLCDNCSDTEFDPNDFNPGQEDADGDGVGDACDNCPTTPNPRPPRLDDAAPLLGGDCDADPTQDLAPPSPGLDQCDSDFDDTNGDGVWDEDGADDELGTPDDEPERPDGIGDGCDNCPRAFNPPQSDSDFMDLNGDGIFDPDGEDDIPGNADDETSDGYGNACDNCPFVFNPAQDPGDCACAFGRPGETLTAGFGDDHLVLRKATAEPDAVWLTSESANGSPSLAFMGLGITPNAIDHYNFYRGTLESLRDPSMGYDHVPFPDQAESCSRTEGPVLDRDAQCPDLSACNGYYYLVAPVCAAQGLEGPLGVRQSNPPVRDVTAEEIDPSSSPCP